MSLQIAFGFLVWIGRDIGNASDSLNGLRFLGGDLNCFFSCLDWRGKDSVVDDLVMKLRLLWRGFGGGGE